MKVIITGATGMVGEGVLLECLQNPEVNNVLIVSRKHYDLEHPKLREIIVPDFFKLEENMDDIREYDACFFCAGISSVGMNADKFTHITYDTTLAFAKVLQTANNNMAFCYVSGAHTDSTENGKVMWARVKGRTENDLAKLFKKEYNFRPGVMLPYPGQKNWKGAYKFIARLIKAIAPKSVLNIQEVGKAMINVSKNGYPKNVLEIKDIKQAAKLL